MPQSYANYTIASSTPASAQRPSAPWTTISWSRPLASCSPLVMTVEADQDARIAALKPS